jgi:hypothetical protein
VEKLLVLMLGPRFAATRERVDNVGGAVLFPRRLVAA